MSDVPKDSEGILLTRAELSLAKLAPEKPERYALNGIAVTAEHTVVTDGWLLAAIEHQRRYTRVNFPHIEGTWAAPPPQGEPVLIATSAALSAAKELPKATSLPVIKHAALLEGSVLATTDLSNTSQYAGKLEGRFPQWSKVIPTKKPIAECHLNPVLLKRVLDLIVAETAKDRRGLSAKPLRLTLYRDSVRIDAGLGDCGDQAMTAIVMGMDPKGTHYAQRPHEAKAIASAAGAEGAPNPA